MDTRETQAAKAAETAAPHTVPRDICALVILKTFFTLAEIILAYTGMCYALLPKTDRRPEIHLPSSKKAHYGINKLSNKIKDND